MSVSPPSPHAQRKDEGGGGRLESMNASELIVAGLGNVGRVERISRRLGRLSVVGAVAALLKSYRDAADGLELRLLRRASALLWFLSPPSPDSLVPQSC